MCRGRFPRRGPRRRRRPFQRLVDGDGADRDGRVADDPFAGVVDVAAGGEVHDGVGAPADRPDHLVDLGRDVGGYGGIADVGVDLDEAVAADRHRLGFRVADVAGDDGADAGDFVAHEFGGDVIGDFGAEVLAVTDVLAELFAAEILADGDIFHLGGDDAFAGVVHLGDVGAGTRAKDRATDVGEGLHAAGTVGAELAVILGADLALGDVLHVSPASDPVAAELGEAGHDVDAGFGIGVGAGAVVDAERRFAGGGFEVDLAHGDAVLGDGDLPRSEERSVGKEGVWKCR